MKPWNLLVIVLAMVISAACTSQPDEIPDQVSVQLKWLHQAQFAGFYVAQEQGFYAEENLDVTLLEGGPDVNIVANVVDGAADFGVYSSENLIVERSQGKPVVAIAAIFRRSPLVFVSLASSGIQRPKDMIGRSGALAPEAMIQLQAMLNRLGLDPAQVENQPYQYDHAQLYSGEVDFTYGYSTGGLIRMYETGYDFNVIYPGDYGVHLYADTLFTTDAMLAEKSDLTTRFLRATLRGWQHAIENGDVAIAATLVYAKEADPDLQARMMEASVPLIHTGFDQIGWMQVDIWQSMHDILLDQGLLRAALDIGQVFTMEHLEAVYK